MYYFSFSEQLLFKLKNNGNSRIVVNVDIAHTNLRDRYQWKICHRLPVDMT